MPNTISPVQRSTVTDAKSCQAWLATAALADARQACRELTGLLESLEDSPPADADYLDILERLREPIVIAQAEHAKKFAGRPLPLKDYEAAAFEQIVDLWLATGRAYRRLLRNVLDERANSLAGQEALLAQRALDCHAELVMVHYRSRREVDSELWQLLNQLYQTADALGAQLRPVPASRRSKSVSSCAEVYIRALLMHLANPYGLHARELAWTRRWATMWAYKVDLARPTDDVQGYAVDLGGNQPPAWAKGESATSTMRFLDTSNLRKSVRSRLKKLETGVDPQTLGLGKDCVQPEVGRLLVALARNWIEAPSARQFTRRAVSGGVELLIGLQSIHTAIGGKMLRSAAHHWDYSRRDAEQIFIYQGVRGTDEGRPTALPAERWETLDESAKGFRLRRKGPGERLHYQQLVALKPEGAPSFILSEVRWLMVGIDNSVTIGTSALPGLATAAAVRPLSGAGTGEPHTQAFLLPEALNSPQSLVLPSGWYHYGRELELRIENATSRIRLGGLAQRGFDYDRANFTIFGQESGSD